MEELKRQMSESMPGTMPVFAEALQRMEGGDLKGQKAIAYMLEQVSAGNVESGKILPIVAELMSERAKGGLAEAVRTSQAEQERFQNTIDDLLILAEPQTEEAFGNIFRTLSSGLRSAEAPLLGAFSVLEGLSEIFQGFGYVSGNVVKGWSEINALVKRTTDSLVGVEVGFLEVGTVAGLALTKIGRKLTRVLGPLLLVEDVLRFIRGEGNTVTGRVSDAIRDIRKKNKPLDLYLGTLDTAFDLVGNAGAIAGEQTMDHKRAQFKKMMALPGLSSDRFNQLLKNREKFDPDTPFKPGNELKYMTPARKLSAIEQGFGEFGRAPGDPGYTKPSPERIAYLRRMKDINDMELRRERALMVDEGLSAEMADKKGDEWARPLERQALKDYREGSLNINADVNVTGETTEEATEKFRVSVEGILDDMFMEAYSPFVKQDF